MPKSTTFPALKIHKPSGYWTYFHRGKRHYLDKDYQRAVELHRLAVLALNGAPPEITSPARPGGLLVAEAISLFLTGPVAAHENRDAQRNRYALTYAATHFGMIPAESFRVAHVEQLAKLWADTPRANHGKGKARREAVRTRDGAKLSRQYVAKLLGCVRQCWRWLALHDHVTADCAAKVTLAVGAVKKIAMVSAPETAPADPEAVRKTLELLAQPFADMVRVQAATGMRTGELLAMRPGEIDRSGPVWCYRPPRHKNAWRGHSRAIYFGAGVQAILTPYLGASGTLFGATFSGYAQALRRAQIKAGVPRWRAYGLRHGAATHVRSNHGDAATKLLLGHAGDDLLDLYAGRAVDERARRAAA